MAHAEQITAAQLTRDLMSRLLHGHQDAVDLCMAVFKCANDYDHLIDRDPLPAGLNQTLHEIVWALAVEIPSNPFYVAHQVEMVSGMATGIATWKASVELQRAGDPHAMTLAHVLRWTLIEFFLLCARLVGGRAWADSQAPAFWRAMTQDHSFDEFVASAKGD